MKREQLFIDQGIEVVQEKGNTPLKELADTHYEALVKTMMDWESLRRSF